MTSPLRSRSRLGWKPSPRDDWSSLSNWEFIDDHGLRRSAENAVAGNWETKPTVVKTIYARYLNRFALDGAISVEDSDGNVGETRLDVLLPIANSQFNPLATFIYGLQTNQVQDKFVNSQ